MVFNVQPHKWPMLTWWRLGAPTNLFLSISDRLVRTCQKNKNKMRIDQKDNELFLETIAAIHKYFGALLVLVWLFSVCRRVWVLVLTSLFITVQSVVTREESFLRAGPQPNRIWGLMLSGTGPSAPSKVAPSCPDDNTLVFCIRSFLRASAYVRRSMVNSSPWRQISRIRWSLGFRPMPNSRPLPRL